MFAGAIVLEGDCETFTQLLNRLASCCMKGVVINAFTNITMPEIQQRLLSLLTLHNAPLILPLRWGQSRFWWHCQLNPTGLSN